jgi:hypothetical protein
VFEAAAERVTSRATVAAQSRCIEVSAAVRIDCPIADVYAFITTPRNWIGNHRSTLDVLGPSGGSEPLGASFTEIIRTRFGRLPATWTVVEAQAPYVWTIRTEGFCHTSATITIRYLLTPDAGMTLFERRMTVLPPPGLLGAIAGRIFARKGVHELYLRTVKARLEPHR